MSSTEAVFPEKGTALVSHARPKKRITCDTIKLLTVRLLVCVCKNMAVGRRALEIVSVMRVE